MLAFSLVCGLLTLLVVGIGYALYRGLPERWACPRCHHATTPVTPRSLRRILVRLQWRWCPRCHWSGLARARTPRKPETRAAAVERLLAPRIPGPETFRWGAPDPSRAPVFRWAGGEEPHPPPPGPAHSSGFRWGSRDPRAGSGPTPGGPPADDPPGFCWREGSGPEAPAVSWAPEPERDPFGFTWGRPSGPGA